MGVILRSKLAMHNKYMSKLPCVSLSNFLSCVSAKHDLNWFTVGKVITKITSRSAIVDKLRCNVGSLWQKWPINAISMHLTLLCGAKDIKKC